jgi:tRNA threonylcarbamoyl adenosine modification protein (Sua5/YciO/YrdC/YwlC family)
VADLLDSDAPDAVDAAARAVARGDLIVLPTDTVYGLAARPDLPGGTERVFEAKRRPRGLSLPVLAPDLEAASALAVFDGRASALAGAFWPGGLTLVLPRSDLSRPWDLGEERATVGVRVPGHPVARRLLASTGPLAVTSANRSGEPPAATCRDAERALGDDVAVYLCAGRLPGTASTIVDLTGDRPRILRTGAVSPDDVLAALGPAGA